MFSYQDFIHRNIGFVSPKEQEILRHTKVFIAGVGGMGGACLLNLVRAGIGEVWIADFDEFEVSNLNRQVFANLDHVGVGKVEATVEQLKKINPELIIKTFNQEWVKHLDGILNHVDIVVNGCDDSLATITLMREAKKYNKTVIDAFAAPLPNVYVVRPSDPRPEEFMNYPSRKLALDKLNEEVLKACFEKELLYVLTSSSSQYYVDKKATRELFEGTRKRFSFAPMVITTGAMMAFEVIRFALNREQKTLYKGYFFNPWKIRIEKRPIFLGLVFNYLRTILFFRKLMK